MEWWATSFVHHEDFIISRLKELGFLLQPLTIIYIYIYIYIYISTHIYLDITHQKSLLFLHIQYQSTMIILHIWDLSSGFHMSQVFCTMHVEYCLKFLVSFGLSLLDLEVRVLLGVEDKNSIRKIIPYGKINGYWIEPL